MHYPGYSVSENDSYIKRILVNTFPYVFTALSGIYFVCAIESCNNTNSSKTLYLSSASWQLLEMLSIKTF